MLNLSDVTLISIDTVCHELTQMAVADCKRHANFGDIKIFSDRDNENVIRIKPFSNLTEAGNFTVYELPKLIHTSHCLFIHYDSWILDPGMWTDDYLSYDYIGAPWWFSEGFRVGNSGFCLRSTALMRFMANNKEEFPLDMPEDVILCRKYRPRLPQFKWAPIEVAQNFAFERVKPAMDSRHFGFHGTFNWPFVLSYEELNKRMAVARRTPYLQGRQLDEIDGLWYARWGHLVDQAPIYKG